MALNFPTSPEIDDTYTSGNNTWRWDGTAWNIIATSYDATVVSIPTDIGDLTDVSNIIPTTLTDLGISDGTDGQVLTTDGAGSFTFTTVSGAGGGSGAIEDLDDVVLTDLSTGQILKYDGAQWVNSADATGTGGGSSFNELSDAVTASLTLDRIYEPAIVMLRMDNIGATSYTVPSHYTGENPSVFAIAGTTIAFDLNGIQGHPLEIQTATGTAISAGLVHVANDGTVSTDGDAQGKDSGTLYWRINESISGTFRYQCQIHAGMVGAISVKRLSTL